MRTRTRHLYNALRGLRLAIPPLGTRLLAFNAGGSFPGTTSTACILVGLRLVLRLTLADRPWEGWSPAQAHQPVSLLLLDEASSLGPSARPAARSRWTKCGRHHRPSARYRNACVAIGGRSRALECERSPGFIGPRRRVRGPHRRQKNAICGQLSRDRFVEAGLRHRSRAGVSSSVRDLRATV